MAEWMAKIGWIHSLKGLFGLSAGGEYGERERDRKRELTKRWMAIVCHSNLYIQTHHLLKNHLFFKHLHLENMEGETQLVPKLTMTKVKSNLWNIHTEWFMRTILLSLTPMHSTDFSLWPFLTQWIMLAVNKHSVINLDCYTGRRSIKIDFNNAVSVHF